MLAIEKRNGELAARLMTEHLQDATALLTREQVRHKQHRLYSHVARTRKPVLTSKDKHRE
jgi:hypothetical protein